MGQKSRLERKRRKSGKLNFLERLGERQRRRGRKAEQAGFNLSLFSPSFWVGHQQGFLPPSSLLPPPFPCLSRPLSVAKRGQRKGLSVS